MHISTYRCIRCIDSSEFLSGSSDSLVKTLVDNSNKLLKILMKEIVDDDNILNIVKETETWNSGDMNNKDKK